MKRLFRWLLCLVLAAAVLMFLGLIYKDSILRFVVEHRIRAQTGMKARIGKLSSGVFSPVVTLQDFMLYNGADFGGTPFLDIPELHVEFDPVALSQRQLHVLFMRLNLNELVVVKNESGRTNVTSLVQQIESSGGGPGGTQKLLQNFRFTGIDVLELTLGKTKYIDLKDARNNRELEVNLQNQVFKNVKTDADLYGVVFLLWLRSHGRSSIVPADATNDLFGR